MLMKEVFYIMICEEPRKQEAEPRSVHRCYIYRSRTVLSIHVKRVVGVGGLLELEV